MKNKITPEEAVRTLLACPLNHSQSEQYVVKALVKGALVSDANAMMQHSNAADFRHYYGMEYDEFLLNAGALLSHPDPVEVALDAIGRNTVLCKNYYALKQYDSLDLLDDFDGPFRGEVITIDAMTLTDRTIRVVTAAELKPNGTAKKWKYYAARDCRTVWDTFEDALMYELFGKDLRLAAQVLYAEAQNKG